MFSKNLWICLCRVYTRYTPCDSIWVLKICHVAGKGSSQGWLLELESWMMGGAEDSWMVNLWRIGSIMSSSMTLEYAGIPEVELKKPYKTSEQSLTILETWSKHRISCGWNPHRCCSHLILRLKSVKINIIFPHFLLKSTVLKCFEYVWCHPCNFWFTWNCEAGHTEAYHCSILVWRWAAGAVP